MPVDGVGERLHSMDNEDDGEKLLEEDGQSRQEQNRATRGRFYKQGRKMVYAKKNPGQAGQFH